MDTRRSRNKADVTTLVILKPTGPEPINTDDVQQTGPKLVLHILDQNSDNASIVKLILAAVEALKGSSPESRVDILLAAMGGTGAGKGVTLMGQGVIEGVISLLLKGLQSSDLGAKAEIQVLEFLKPPQGTALAIKDLVQVNPKVQSTVPRDFAGALPTVVKHARKTTIGELSRIARRRMKAEAEHQHSSRSTVLVTMQQGNCRTSIIDPPGQESPKIETKNPSHGQATQGTDINKGSEQLRDFIQAVRRGEVVCKANSAISSIASLHQSGNKILLCVLAVLYAGREPDQSTSSEDMKRRDVGLVGFIKGLCGAPTTSVNSFVSQELRKTGQQTPMVQFDGRLVTMQANKVDIGLDDVKGNPLVQAHLEKMGSRRQPEYIKGVPSL